MMRLINSPNRMTCYACGAQHEAQAPSCHRCQRPLLVGQRYRCVRALGKGGCGEVYEARDLLGNHPCAIKRMPRSLDHIVEREATALARLGALGCAAALYGDLYDQSHNYLILQHIEGLSLDRWPADYWDAPRVERLVRVILGQLAAIHAQGVVHGDLKPANIVRTFDRQYMLIDFGSATLPGERHVADQRHTPAFAAPEQFEGRPAQVASDLYGLAATAYFLLTGHMPTAAERRAGARLESPRRRAPTASPRLERALLAMLELDPRRRPASAAAALELLEGVRAPATAHLAAAGGWWDRVGQFGNQLITVLTIWGLVALAIIWAMTRLPGS